MPPRSNRNASWHHMGSCYALAQVDSAKAASTGIRLDSTRIPDPPRNPPLERLDRQQSLAMWQTLWTPASRVASQKIGPDAGDIARFARQHTNIAWKEPETAVGWTPAGPSLDTGVQVAPVNAKGRASFPAHSPHLAFGIARSCCRCRRKKCCNTLESLRIQARGDLGQRELPTPPCGRAVATHLAADLLPRHPGGA